MAEVEVCPVDELPPGAVKIVRVGDLAVGVYNLGGELYALEDRCVVICPRHGSEFDIRTGVPLSLPAYVPVSTYPVRVEDGVVIVEVP